MTDAEIQLLAKSIIDKIERRGGNYDLAPRIHGDGIGVAYVTDCDRLGYVDNFDADHLLGFPLEVRERVVEAMIGQLYYTAVSSKSSVR